MRVIFMGTPPFAVVCLQKMFQEKVDVVAVVTAPDRPVGRGQKVRPSAVKEAALAAEIPVMQPEKLNDPGFLKEIEELKPDLMVIVAFRILPEALFSIPTKGAVNLHGS
ncbi:MAG: methionyl-tRNA formyltransferase, partial [Calditrichales bacterium]